MVVVKKKGAKKKARAPSPLSEPPLPSPARHDEACNPDVSDAEASAEDLQCSPEDIQARLDAMMEGFMDSFEDGKRPEALAKPKVPKEKKRKQVDSCSSKSDSKRRAVESGPKMEVWESLGIKDMPSASKIEKVVERATVETEKGDGDKKLSKKARRRLRLREEKKAAAAATAVAAAVSAANSKLIETKVSDSVGGGKGKGKGGKGDGKGKGKGKGSEEWLAAQEQKKEFRNMVKEMNRFVMPKMEKRLQHQFEEAKIVALGGKLEKRQKKPYTVIQRLAKERKEKLKELKEEEKQLGVKMQQHTFAWKVDSDRKKKKELKAMSARRFSKRLLSIGYQKDGELRVSKKLFGDGK